MQVTAARAMVALLAVAIAIEGATLAAVSRRPPPALPRWEYEVAAVREPELTSALGRVGSEGWEVVSVRRVDVSRDDRGPDWRVELVMKRQLLTPLRAE